MQLTTHTDYALRLLIYLATHDGPGPATIQDAARRFAVSANHLAKVAQTLVHHDYIVSHRGRGGGLKLARPPVQIRIGDVVRQIENLQLLACFGEEKTCMIQPDCTLRTALGKAQQAFLSVLDEYSLADLTANKARLQALLSAADE